MDLKKVLEVLQRSRRINLKEREPLPQGEAYIVAEGGKDYYATTFFYHGLKYTDHRPENNSFGGYIVPEDYGGPYETAIGYINTWWTMNVGYSKMCRDYCWVVRDYEDGWVLSEFLNLNKQDPGNINAIICDKQMQVNQLNKEIEQLKEMSLLWNQ